MDKKIQGLEIFIFDLGNNGKVYDAFNRVIESYPESTEIMRRLKSLGYRIGVASRTSCIEEANDLIRLFDWDCLIDFKQIYPGRKTSHIGKIKEESGYELNEMIFYDDENRNIVDLERINVCSILVPDGINFGILQKGIDKFLKKKIKPNKINFETTSTSVKKKP
ncbi:Magnesium-dependent phosphatase-like protein [Sarcoptes scabiei]|uniref:Magnesium-dependent phosphatase-like protein n=1 Tax=Sarcoptes scabiei TaxID=52283 RepID=A0A132A3A3_SARSC|nr:Magnesium-dependent phosphatase-like protein [Sarcoptes scabiei]